MGGATHPAERATGGWAAPEGSPGCRRDAGLAQQTVAPGDLPTSQPGSESRAGRGDTVRGQLEVQEPLRGPRLGWCGDRCLRRLWATGPARRPLYPLAHWTLATPAGGAGWGAQGAWLRAPAPRGLQVGGSQGPSWGVGLQPPPGSPGTRPPPASHTAHSHTAHTTHTHLPGTTGLRTPSAAACAHLATDPPAATGRPWASRFSHGPWAPRGHSCSLRTRSPWWPHNPSPTLGSHR